MNDYICPGCGVGIILPKPAGSVNGPRADIAGQCCRAMWVRLGRVDRMTVWCIPCWRDAGALPYLELAGPPIGP